MSLKDSEKNAVMNALMFTRGVKKKAANLLGISRKTLLDKIKVYQLNEYLPTREAGQDDDDDADADDSPGEVAAEGADESNSPPEGDPLIRH
jgi:hypothetical protein